MFFSPYEKFVIRTELAADEVEKKLLSVVETQKFWASPLSTTKRYFGEVKKSSFEIRKVSWNGRAILPVVVGSIIEDKSGSDVYMRVHLNWLELMLYLLVWGFFGYVALANLGDDFLVSNSEWLDHSVASLALALISFSSVYLLLLIPVKIEVALSKKFFLELLSGKLKMSMKN